jgi:dienelactone hydrolase
MVRPSVRSPARREPPWRLPLLTWLALLGCFALAPLAPAASAAPASPAAPAAAAGAAAAAESSGAMSRFASAGGAVPIERFDPPGKIAGRRPAVILLHGAEASGTPGWSGAYRAYARNLAAAGFIVFLPHYFERADATAPRRADPDQGYGGWLTVVTDAVGFVARQPAVTPGKLGLSGFSLGSSLALAAASRDPRIAAVVEAAGALADRETDVKRLPPVLILHGDADPVIPVEEAYRLQKLLQDGHQRFEIKIYPGLGHGFTPSAEADSEDRAIAFFRRHLG